MRIKIESKLLIECTQVDFDTVTHIEFYLRQGDLLYQYTPQIIAPHQLLVTVPYNDAMQLKPTNVLLQFAYTDADGNPRASGIVQIPVGELLKEAGYDPV